MTNDTKDTELREAFLDLMKLMKAIDDQNMFVDPYVEREIKRIGKIAEKLFAETQRIEK